MNISLWIHLQISKSQMPLSSTKYVTFLHSHWTTNSTICSKSIVLYSRNDLPWNIQCIHTSGRNQIKICPSKKNIVSIMNAVISLKAFKTMQTHIICHNFHNHYFQKPFILYSLIFKLNPDNRSLQNQFSQLTCLTIFGDSTQTDKNFLSEEFKSCIFFTYHWFKFKIYFTLYRVTS